MAPVKVPGVDIPEFFGPLVLGFVWGSILYGMLIVQVYMYSKMFKNDLLGIKILVWVVFTLETIFTVFVNIAAWKDFGIGWGDVDSFTYIDWAWLPLPEINGILSALAQSFYMWRIYRLTHRWYIPLIISLPMFAQLIVSFWYGIGVSIHDVTFAHLATFSPQITVWLVGAALCDLGITTALVITLWSQKKTTAFQKTTGVIDRLIRFSIETGALTSTAAILEVILWLAAREVNWHFTLFFTIGRLYSNMLMATLNIRAPLFRQDTTMMSLPMTSFWAEPGQTKSTGVSVRRGVHIGRTTETDLGGTGTIIMSDFHDSQHNSTGKVADKGYNSFGADGVPAL
ncbi:hypothetical protein B0H10DRAFT_2055914 [Mycena sp. CBHHK59/15]|nr:hypothetical protein B0H10DRAFT_2055914 [Mycena sp. CBHHK59/15]